LYLPRHDGRGVAEMGMGIEMGMGMGMGIGDE
jgi:hypothetical protein